MAETTKKVNTIKSIGKKVAENGDANDYIYIPIGADSDNVDRPDGSTVEESLEKIETEKTEIIPVETLPTEDIKTYPFIYALVNVNEKKGVFYEYKNNEWIKYGNSSEGIWVGTREECLAALKKNKIETGTILFVIKKSDNNEDTHVHDYVCQITKEPTYSETGTKLYTCLLCLESYEEEIPALIDTINPAGVIKIGEKEYCTWKDTIFFETYYNENQTVTIEAADNETGVKETAYYLADTAISESDLATVEWTVYTEPFQIEPNNNYIVYARIKDNADNVIYICSDGIVLDNIAPVFDGLEDGGTYPEGTVITVGEGETLTVNGEVVELADNTYTLNVPDNYLLSVTDRAGNSSEINIVIEVTKTELSNWEYELDDEKQTVTLIEYIGKETDIIVYNSYTNNDKNYTTIFRGKYKNEFSHPLGNNRGEINSIIFEPNIKILSAYGLFSGCSKLKVIDINKADFSDSTNIRAMFENCYLLQNIDLSNINFTKVEDMSYMFFHCDSLENITFDEKYTISNIINLEGMFRFCLSLITVELCNFVTSKVTSMNYMFQGCNKLEHVYVKENNWVISSECTTSNMFKSCNISSVTYV